jgi:hypothetical protein
MTRRVLLTLTFIATAASFFVLGMMRAHSSDALDRETYDAKLDAIRAEVRGEVGRDRPTDILTAATSGRAESAADSKRAAADRQRMVNEIKEQLQNEMGLTPVQVLRQRQSSFVELYSTDTSGKINYGTAGYLGHGYFITVKHAVVALKGEDELKPARRIVTINVMYHGKEIPASVVDAGNADVEVHNGDWAVLKTSHDLDLPPLRVNTAFSYDFAAPIFRLGNDYSKGIILSSGYVGQHTANGLVTCLTDGHPGVSGGGVIDQRGDLVGIPIGRMQGDYRFSFILPLRAEMLRKVPAYAQAEPHTAVATEQQQ